jgi:dihydroorotate dehydrogenase (fumarate)
VQYSTETDSLIPLRWIAILYGRIPTSLAATSGIHHGADVLKMMMAGADVTMLCSTLMRNGIQHLRTVEEQVVRWMEDHGFDSIEQLKGIASQRHCPDASAFERAHYVRAIGVHAHH